jgi:hypothetical protein
LPLLVAELLSSTPTKEVVTERRSFNIPTKNAFLIFADLFQKVLKRVDTNAVCYAGYVKRWV